MSRSLSILLLVSALLTGCSSLQRGLLFDTNVSQNEATVLSEWLQLHTEVQKLSEDKIVDQLVGVGLPEGKNALYYYGLLNQQLNSYGAWIQARDAFSKLGEVEDLIPGQKVLAAVFLGYNQERINAYSKINKQAEEVSSLESRVAALEEEKRLLEQKIRALTDLESVISTRKEE